MARRRRRSNGRFTSTSAPAARIVRVNSPSPIIRVQTQRASPARRSRGRGRRRRSSSGGGGLGGIVSNESMQLAIGGALYGYAVKQGIVAKLPALPFLGRTGTAAILLDYWARHGGGNMVHKAARAAAAIAGYQLGAEGAIQGDAGTPVEGDNDVDGYEPED